MVNKICKNKFLKLESKKRIAMKIGKLEILFGKKKSYRELEEVIARANGPALSSSKTNPVTQLAEYNSWQYDCVSLISDKVSSTSFSFYNKITGEEISTKNHNYKLISKPFLEPNNLMSFRFIKSWCQIQLDLCGMAMIYKAKNLLGQVWELWPLNMNDLIGIYPNYQRQNKLLPETYYHFSIDGNYYIFSQDDVIFLMYPHPKYLDRGASPIQAQAYNVDIEKYIEVYERDFFANSARVDMILKTDQDLDEDTAKKVKETWRDAFRGKFHDIVVLGSNLQPIPMKWTNKDFEFLNLSKWSRDKILAAYKVPASKLGITDSTNRSGGVTSENNFHQDCIQPRLNIWDEECTKEIISAIDPKIEMLHDNPLPRDRQIEVSEARVYLSGAACYTINEIRNLKGLKSQENGDRILVPSGFVFLDRLDEVMDNSLGSSSNNSANNEDTDPSRHDNDTSHLNPDGSDNRDENPTEGRAFIVFENNIKDMWHQYLNLKIKKCNNEDKLIDDVFILVKSTIIYYFKLMKCSMVNGLVNNKIDSDFWLLNYSKVVAKNIWEAGFSKEINNAVIVWEDYCDDQFKLNSKLVKICYSASLACINYAKYRISIEKNLKTEWKFNNNFCIHKHRVIKTLDGYTIGTKTYRFPGESLNLNCDCSLNLIN